MPVPNSEVARIFDEYADLLEINGANEYRVRAYRTAARNISYLSHNLTEMVKQGEDLSALPGIGENLAGKITEIVKTGHLTALEQLKKNIPEELINITRIAGLGPRRAYRLYYGLGITSIEELEEAAREGALKELPGFGIKLEQAILEDIKRRGELREGKPVKLPAAEESIQTLLAHLSESSGIRQIEAAGNYRRGTETVSEVTLIADCEKDSDIMTRFVNYNGSQRTVSFGDARSTIILSSGLQVELRIVPEESFGAALFHYTGSKAHTLAVRKRAIRRRLLMNEYGIFKNEKLVAGATEEEIYARVGLQYIEPELRENRGEIEAARDNSLPNLITLQDIRGDLHIHTRASDGHNGLEEMARAALERGYEYLAITEHSRRLTVAHGLDINRLIEQIEEIDRLNQQLKNIVLLKSVEVDILEDGTLDLPDDILRELDLVVCAVHHRFNLPREKQTDRIVRAMHRPYPMILAHPTGRLIDERTPYNLDMERLMLEAKVTGTVLELNSRPNRLDLTDVFCKMARDMGVTIAISSDAHNTAELDFMRYGVIQGKRGWLETGNVLNCRSWQELQPLLKKVRRKPAFTRATAGKALAS